MDFADLLDEPFLALPAEAGPLRDHWLALDAREGRPPRIGAVVAGAEETHEAVAGGQGVVLLAAGNAPLVVRDEVVALPVRGLSPPGWRWRPPGRTHGPWCSPTSQPPARSEPRCAPPLIRGPPRDRPRPPRRVFGAGADGGSCYLVSGASLGSLAYASAAFFFVTMTGGRR